VTRRVPQSVDVADRRGEDAQRQYAARLLWQGWTAEAVAALTGLAIGDVCAIAAAVDADDLTNGAPPP
jgi:hypothetical protein